MVGLSLDSQVFGYIFTILILLTFELLFQALLFALTIFNFSLLCKDLGRKW